MLRSIKLIFGLLGALALPAMAFAQSINVQTGTTYRVTNPDCDPVGARVIVFTNSAGVAVTLPQVGQSGVSSPGCRVTMSNQGNGSVTVTPSPSSLTINGLSQLILPSLSTVVLYEKPTGDFIGNNVQGGGPAIVSTAVTANTDLGTLPANGYILYLLLRETAGHAVSVAVGTTLGGTDVLTAQAVPASGTLTVPITSFSLGWFSATATQALFLTSASWNSASINASLVYQVGP